MISALQAGTLLLLTFVSLGLGACQVRLRRPSTTPTARSYHKCSSRN